MRYLVLPAAALLLSLVHVAFGGTLLAVGDFPARRVASSCLGAATLLVPGGFFLGGIFVYGGDPGLGVLLVPVGALCLLVAIFLTGRAVSGRHQGRLAVFLGTSAGRSAGKSADRSAGDQPVYRADIRR